MNPDSVDTLSTLYLSESRTVVVTRRFVFLLVEGLSMMSLSSAIEPLRSANRLAAQPLYAWDMASLDGTPVQASNGIELKARPLAEAMLQADYLFVCGGLRLDPDLEPRYLRALRTAARSKAVIGSLSTGSYLLARAGLLDGYQCTIHWENLPAFTEEFRDLLCSGKIYEIDRNRMTCSGGIAAMDMMLHLIADAHGADLARGVANQFHHERIRDEREDQRGARLETLAHLPGKARQAIRIMQRQIENPLPLPEIADQVAISARQHMLPVNRGESGPYNPARATECNPSQPITTSNGSSRPSLNVTLAVRSDDDTAAQWLLR